MPDLDLIKQGEQGRRLPAAEEIHRWSNSSPPGSCGRRDRLPGWHKVG
jgi:hypothetical protein